MERVSKGVEMIESITLLRNLAGLMFWGLADFFLGGLWITIIFGLIATIVKGFRHD